MKEPETFPRRVAGHRIENRIYQFPHICPGLDCAIAQWLFRKDERIVYKTLQRETKAS